mgnify:FL=1
MLKLVCLVFALLMLGCSDENNQINNPSNKQETLQPDFLYVSSDALDIGCVFFVFEKEPYQIKTDLGQNTTVISYVFNPENHDSVTFSVSLEQGGTPIQITALKSPFKYSDIPSHSSQYPFDGLGIVYQKELFFKYEERRGQIEVFNLQTGIPLSLSAQRVLFDSVLAIQIEGEIMLKPNPTSPDPLQSNSHRWQTSNDKSSVYRLWWK